MQGTHSTKMDGILSKNLEEELLCVKSTFDMLDVSDPSKPGTKIPKSKFERLDDVWKAVIKSRLQHRYERSENEDEITYIINLLNSFLELIHLKLEKSDTDNVVVKSLMGISMGYGELTGIDIGFCK